MSCAGYFLYQNQLPTAKMDPRPDYGETSYKGSNRLQGKRAIITGGDSGIGRAVAIAFDSARALTSWLLMLKIMNTVKEVAALIEGEGRKVILVEGDVRSGGALQGGCRESGPRSRRRRHTRQQRCPSSDLHGTNDISDEEWRLTFEVNIHAMFFLAKAAVPHMKPGSSIITAASVNSDMPNPTLLAYATTKGASAEFHRWSRPNAREKDIRVNAVAPGPTWTPLIPSTMPEDAEALR